MRIGCTGEESIEGRMEEGRNEVGKRKKKREMEPWFNKLQKSDYRWQDDSQRVCYSCPLSDFVEHLEVTLLLDAVYQNWKFIFVGV